MQNPVKSSEPDLPASGLESLDLKALQIFESTPQEIFIWDSGGTLIFANQRALDFHGFTLDRARKSDFRSKLYHPEDLPMVTEAIKRAVAQGEPLEIRARLLRHDGHYLWFLIRVNPVRDENKRILQWYGTATDVDDEVRAEDRLRLIIDTTPAMVHTALPDGGIDYFNQRWREYLGVTSEEILGWKWTSLIHPDEVTAFVDKWRLSLQTGAPFEAESRVRRADGTYRWLIHRKVPLRDEQGAIIKWYGSSMDIDDRKRAEDELRRSEAVLAQAQRLSHTGSSVWNLAGEMTWSQERFRIFGFDPEKTKASAEAFWERIHPDDRAAYKAFTDAAVRDRRDFEYDYRIVHPDSGIRHLHSVGHVVLNETGEFVEFIGTTMDVTERRLAEEAIRRSEAFLAEGQRLSHTGSFGWNVSTDEHFWSAETFRIFEVDPSSKISLELILQGVHPQDLPSVKTGIAAAASAQGVDLEYRLMMPDGRIKYLHVVATAQKNDTGSVEIVGAVMDVTARKLIEIKLQRSKNYLTIAQTLSRTGSVGMDVNTGKIFWSEEAARINGYPPGTEPTPELILQRVHPDDVSLMKNALERAAQGGHDFEFEHRLLMPDGSIKYIYNLAQCMRDEAGNKEIVGAIMDVTQHRLAEEATRRSEGLLAEGQRLSRTGSWRWNVSTGKVTWSQELFRIFGLDPQITNPSLDAFWERLHPDDRIDTQRAFESAIKEKRDLEREYRIVTPDWSIRHLHGVGHAVLNEANELVEFSGSTVDITERKRAEERAESQREAIQLALNAFVEELDVNRFLGDVIAELNKQFHAKSWELWLFDETLRALLLHSSSHPIKRFSPEFGSKNARPLEELQGIWQTKDAPRAPQVLELCSQKSLLSQRHGKLLKRRGIKTLMIVPLVLGEQNLGFLELHFQAQTQFSCDDLELAQALVNHATLALQLNRLTRRAERLAVTEERNRLAREIHDTLAQTFAGIVLHTEALKVSSGGAYPRSKKSLLQIQKLARSGLDEARRSVQALRPKELHGNTLPQALELAANRFAEDAKILCEFKQTGKALKVSPEVQNELFRIAQEAMTNISKHARAKSVWITLEFKTPRIILTVRDDGIGFPANNSRKRKHGYGLTTMRERSQRIGGRLEIEKPSTGGVTIRVTVPSAKKAKSGATK